MFVQEQGDGVFEECRGCMNCPSRHVQHQENDKDDGESRLGLDRRRRAVVRIYTSATLIGSLVFVGNLIVLPCPIRRPAIGRDYRVASNVHHHRRLAMATTTATLIYRSFAL